MTVRFLEIAEIELDQAIHWYGAQAPGLGNAFLIEVLSAADRIARFPEAWHSLGEGVRRCAASAGSLRADLHHRQRRHLGAGGRTLASSAGLLARSLEAMT